MLASKVVLYLSGPAKTLRLLIRMTRNMTSDTEATKRPALMSVSRDGWTSHFLVCFACAEVHSCELSPVGAGVWSLPPRWESYCCCVTCGVGKPSLLSRWSSSAGLMLLLFCARLCSFSLFVFCSLVLFGSAAFSVAALLLEQRRVRLII